MSNLRRTGIAFMLTSLMVLSVFAFLPATTAASTTSYTWQEYEYPMKPHLNSALDIKMRYTDLFINSLPTTKMLVAQGIFHPDFLVSYQKIMEFLYSSCDPDLWLFHEQMYKHPELYGNYPGDSQKPTPQGAVSSAKKIFQDEFIVVNEISNEVRKLDEDFQDATGMDQIFIYSFLTVYKRVRHDLILSDMKIAFFILDHANDAVDEIKSSNGKIDLSVYGGPSDFTVQNQQQFLKWTEQANGDFDKGIIGLGLEPEDTKNNIITSSIILFSTELDDSAYTSALKSFEKTVNRAGHAIAMSGVGDLCAQTFVLAIPAVAGIVLCSGIAIQKRRRRA